jgi:hypothetical protein
VTCADLRDYDFLFDLSVENKERKFDEKMKGFERERVGRY